MDPDGKPCYSHNEQQYWYVRRHIDIHPLWFSKETNHLVGDLAVITVEGFGKMSLDYVKLPPEQYYPNGKIPVFFML